MTEKSEGVTDERILEYLSFGSDFCNEKLSEALESQAVDRAGKLGRMALLGITFLAQKANEGDQHAAATLVEVVNDAVDDFQQSALQQLEQFKAILREWETAPVLASPKPGHTLNIADFLELLEVGQKALFECGKQSKWQPTEVNRFVLKLVRFMNRLRTGKEGAGIFLQGRNINPFEGKGAREQFKNLPGFREDTADQWFELAWDTILSRVENIVSLLPGLESRAEEHVGTSLPSVGAQQNYIYQKIRDSFRSLAPKNKSKNTVRKGAATKKPKSKKRSAAKQPKSKKRSAVKKPR